MKKKLFSILLSLAMMVTMMPAMTMTAFASTNVSTWQDLQSTITGATDAVEIELTGDLTASATDSAITVGSGRNVTIDLKGHTINRNLSEATANGFVIKVEGNLTIKDSDSGGKITGGFNSNPSTSIAGSGLGIASGGAVTLTGGEITGNKGLDNLYGAGVFVNKNATFNMTGGEISGNSGGQGAGVYSKGTFTMSGNSLITGNTGTFGGGVGINNGGTFTMSDNSKITYNTGSIGGVYVQSDMFTMTGGSIDHNTGSYIGGVGGSFNYITLGGTAKIKDNVKGGAIIGGELSGGAANNVFLTTNKYISLAAGESTPKTGMTVGVTTQQTPSDATPVQLTTNGAANDTQYFFSDSADYYVGCNSSSNYLELKKPVDGNHTITINSSAHGSVTPSLYEASAGATITLTATPDSGYELSANSLKVISADDTVIPVTGTGNAYTFTMPDSNVTVSALFIQTATPPTPPGPTPGPNPEPTPAEEYTVPVESENTVQVEATVDKGKAAVKEITKEIIEEVTKPAAGKEKSDAIVIDLSKAKQDVTAVELTSKTVENLAEAVASKDNAVEKVTIQMAEATVELDAKTLETVSKEAKGDTIKLVVDKTKEENLKPSQKETLSKFDVNKTFEAYFESNGQRISSFNGGKVVVGIKFTPDAGKKAGNYKVYYVDDEGKMQKFASKYADGMLKFSTTHFSDYAIVYEGTKDVLLLNAKASGSEAIKLSWNGIGNATKYVVYGAKCGNEHKKLKTVKGKSYTVKKVSGKKLIAHKAYKFYVVGYDAVGNKVKSRSIHFVTANTQGEYANVKSIKAKYKDLTLGVGASKKLGATYKMYAGKKHIKKTHGKALRYISSNPEVAKVSSSGKVTAVSTGTATIYIQDIGGKYCKTKVTVE